ncbi:hypothetical protein PC39_13852 [Salinisphaera sp. PC39]|uniref:MerC domain-containing protein n=1 Tax=Salinisphaera sp. PC39 TaxID=1304156 RepID=UPI00334144DA
MHSISSRRLDRIAVTASAACTVHCLAAPVLAVLAPTLAGAWLAGTAVHLWLLAIVVPTSVSALFMGWRRHHAPGVAIAGVAGLLLLTAAALAIAPRWGENAERVATVTASFLLAAAHIGNYRLCRQRSRGHDRI